MSHGRSPDQRINGRYRFKFLGTSFNIVPTIANSRSVIQTQFAGFIFIFPFSSISSVCIVTLLLLWSAIASKMPSAIYGVQNNWEQAQSLLEEMVSQFGTLKSSDYCVSVEQHGQFGWHVVTRCRIQQHGLRLRCDYSGRHMATITIVSPEDIDVAAASFQRSPENQNGIHSVTVPNFCVGDEVVGRDIFAVVSNLVLMANLGSNPAFDREWFKPGVDPARVVIEEYSKKYHDQGQTSISEGEIEGVTCKVITFAHQDSPQRTVRWFLGGSPLKMLRRENQYLDKSQHWFVSEWHDLSETAGLAIPKRVEWYTLKDGRRSEEGRMVVSDLKINGTVPESAFRVRDIEGLKPGQPVTFSDSRPYPCPLTEQLFWDGQKLVCGNVDGVAAILGTRAKRNWIRTGAIWLASLGGLAGCWILTKRVAGAWDRQKGPGGKTEPA